MLHAQICVKQKPSEALGLEMLSTKTRSKRVLVWFCPRRRYSPVKLVVIVNCLRILPLSVEVQAFLIISVCVEVKCGTCVWLSASN